MTVTQDMFKMAEEMEPELIATRRDFHEHPELGFEEMRTSSLIARKLTEMGFDEVLVGRDVCDDKTRMGVPAQEELDAAYQRAEAEGGDPEFLPAAKDGFTGVIGILHCGEGPTVALRFDIDALPIQETHDKGHFPADNGFASIHEHTMHACGHDGHATIGLGTAKVLMHYRDQLHGTIKFIFQPSEEGVRGARSIVEKGHLDGVDYCLGAHIGGNKDLDHCFIGANDCRTMATTKLNVTFHGVPSHAAAAPESGKNAMLAMATAVLNLQAIPRYSAAATRINVGKVVAGGGRNIICDRAYMEMEVRGMSTEANEYMYDYAMRIIKAAAEMHDCTYDVDIVGAAQSNLNSPELTQRVLKVLADNGLEAKAMPNPVGGGSEDYSYMSERVRKNGGQSCYFMNQGYEAGPHHNDHFDYDEKLLVQGVKAFSAVVYDLLK